jgi:hypothetical protein
MSVMLSVVVANVVAPFCDMIELNRESDSFLVNSTRGRKQRRNKNIDGTKNDVIRTFSDVIRMEWSALDANAVKCAATDV